MPSAAPGRTADGGDPGRRARSAIGARGQRPGSQGHYEPPDIDGCGGASALPVGAAAVLAALGLILAIAAVWSDVAPRIGDALRGLAW